MPDSKQEWDFGQALIELDHATLDQVREGISIQERMKSMGILPKSLREILLEKRYITPDQAEAAARKALGATTKGVIGTDIPGYDLKQRIGNGAMGVVFRAHQRSLDRDVAVKILAPRYSKSREYIKRFLSEAKAVAKLHHPNIVAGIDVGEANGIYYFVMEFVEGQTLRQLLDRRGHLEEREALGIALQMAHALDHAYRHKIIHRDVKPGNIMILPDGLAKLCDLGLAREIKGETGTEEKAIGTPNYISPEQARGELDLDTRADIYSLGATLYHMLTGVTPFRAVSSDEMLVKHVSEPLVPPRKMRATISEPASQLIARMLEKDRQRRPANPFELIPEIERLQAAARGTNPAVAPAGVSNGHAPPPPGAHGPVPSASPGTHDTRHPRGEASPAPSSTPSSRALPPRRVAAPGSSSFAYVFLGVIALAFGALFLLRDSLFGKSEKSPVEKTRLKVNDGTPVSNDDPVPGEELAQIRILQENDANFDKIDEITRRYAEFANKYQGTRWEGEARQRVVEYGQKLEEFAKAQLAEIQSKEKAPRAAGRFSEVLKIYRTFPAKFLKVTDAGKNVAREIETLQSRVLEAYAGAKVEINVLVKQQRFEEALLRIAELEKTIAPEQAADLAQLKAGVIRQYDEKSGAVRKEVADKYFAIDGPFKDAMRRKDPRAAAEHIKVGFLNQPWTDEQTPFARVPNVDYAVLGGLIDGWQCDEIIRLCEDGAGDPEDPALLLPSRAALLDLRNAAALELFLLDAQTGIEKATAANSREKYQLETYHRDLGYFVYRNNKLYYLIENQRLVPLDQPDPLRMLMEEDLVILAARALDEARDPAMKKFEASATAQARAGLFYYYSGKAMYSGKSLQHLETATKLGAKGTRIFVANIVEATKARSEAELKKRVDEARGLVQKKQYAQARPILEELLKLEHPYVVSIKEELGKLLTESLSGLSAAERLEVEYKGKVEFNAKGELRVTYDFKNKAHAEAFEPIEKEGSLTFKGRWKIDRAGFESGMGKSASRWKPRVKGDVEVEYDLFSYDDPQNIVIDVYYNPGKAEHYGVTFGFDWVGKDDGDTDNTAEDRNGMPRTCVIKYPVNADKSRWVLPGPWEIWRSRLVGKGTGDYRLPRGKRVHVKFERRGKGVRMSADGTVVWQGEDDSYNDGYLLFFSDCRARIDNLSITFTPVR